MTLEKDEYIVGMEVTNNFEGDRYRFNATIIALTNKGRMIARPVGGNEFWADITPDKRD